MDENVFCDFADHKWYFLIEFDSQGFPLQKVKGSNSESSRREQKFVKSPPFSFPQKIYSNTTFVKGQHQF